MHNYFTILLGLEILVSNFFTFLDNAYVSRTINFVTTVYIMLKNFKIKIKVFILLYLIKRKVNKL